MHRLSRRHPVPVLAGGDFQGWLEGAGTLPFGLVASNPLEPGAEGPGGAAEGGRRWRWLGAGGLVAGRPRN